MAKEFVGDLEGTVELAHKEQTTFSTITKVTLLEEVEGKVGQFIIEAGEGDGKFTIKLNLKKKGV